jgi:nitrogen-specific signal transduction histidine kinase
MKIKNRGIPNPWRHYLPLGYILALLLAGQVSPPPSINELFRPFFTTKKGGTGLGIAVSYKLIQDHNGDIKIKSEPYQGTVVTIQIPLRR